VLLRWKVSLVILVAVIGLVAAILMISQMTFNKDFQKVDNQRAIEMAQRANSAFSQEINSIDTINCDYAVWDDTYSFIVDPNSHLDYITSNYNDTTFINANVNFILLYDNSGNCEYSRGFNLIDDTDLPIPDSLFTNISTKSLLHHSSVDDISKGIISLPEGPLLVSSRPIIHSDGQGPIVGTLIMARLLDSKVITEINDLVLSPVNTMGIEEARIELTDVSFSKLLTSSACTQINNSKQISGYYVVNDITGNPAMILKVDISRDIYNHGIITTRYFVISLLGLGVFFILGINLFFMRTVTSRVDLVGSYLDKINKKGDFSTRLFISGKDELSHLSQDMNKLVQTLQDLRNELQTKEKMQQTYQQMIESSIEGFVFTNTTGIIIDLNDAKVQLHGYSSRSELIGTKIFDLVTPEDRLQARDNIEESFETGQIVYSRYDMLRKDGTKFTIKNYVKAVKDAENKPIGFIITSVDVSKEGDTERKRSTEAILVSNI
jgi:PAS domain S-box-containing protein